MIRFSNYQNSIILNAQASWIFTLFTNLWWLLILVIIEFLGGHTVLMLVLYPTFRRYMLSASSQSKCKLWASFCEYVGVRIHPSCTLRPRRLGAACTSKNVGSIVHIHTVQLPKNSLNIKTVVIYILIFIVVVRAGRCRDSSGYSPLRLPVDAHS
jgi:hypothetical protein